MSKAEHHTLAEQRGIIFRLSPSDSITPKYSSEKFSLHFKPPLAVSLNKPPFSFFPHLDLHCALRSCLFIECLCLTMIVPNIPGRQVIYNAWTCLALWLLPCALFSVWLLYLVTEKIEWRKIKFSTSMVPFACWHFPHYANFVHICNCRACETFYTDIYFQVTVQYPKDHLSRWFTIMIRVRNLLSTANLCVLNRISITECM